MPKIEVLDNGQWDITTDHGERFVGDPLEATTKLAESKDHTRNYADTLKAENEQMKQKLAAPSP